MGQDCTGQQRRWASYWLTAEAKCCKNDPKLWELKRKGAGLHVAQGRSGRGTEKALVQSRNPGDSSQVAPSFWHSLGSPTEMEPEAGLRIHVLPL